MSTAIYYFSGTGNSYYVAKELQKRFDDCKLISVASCVKYGDMEINAEKVGFIFPLYYLSMPKAVLEFIKRVRFENVYYIFAVVTRGGGAYQGGALGHLKKILKEKKQQLTAGFYVRMPDNYILSYKVPAEEKQKELFKKADEEIQKISNLLNMSSNKIEIEILGFMRPIIYRYFLKRLNTLHSEFKVSGKCNSCGLCEKVCHFTNIQLHEGRPLWQQNCQFCLACMHYCPHQAIELGRSQNKERYHHPSVSLNGYINLKTEE